MNNNSRSIDATSSLTLSSFLLRTHTFWFKLLSNLNRNFSGFVISCRLSTYRFSFFLVQVFIEFEPKFIRFCNLLSFFVLTEVFRNFCFFFVVYVHSFRVSSPIVVLVHEVLFFVQFLEMKLPNVVNAIRTCTT